MTIARSHQGRAAKYNGNITSIHCVGYARQPCLLSITLGLPAVGLQRHGQHHSICSIAKRVEALRSVLPGQVSGTTTQEVKALPTVKVRLCIQHQVPFGQVLKVVGAGPQFGDWQSAQARELQWTAGHIWVVDLVLEPGTYELKCVTASGDDIIAWEGGANRILQVPDGVKGIRVDGSWAQTAGNRVTVTEPIAAASQAARQKRAAAARLLYKALAEVNAAVALSEASGAVSSRGQAASSPPAASTHNPPAETEIQNKPRKENLSAAGPLSSELDNPGISSFTGVGLRSKAAAEQQQKEDRAGAGVAAKAATSHTAGNRTTAAPLAVDGQEDSPESSSRTQAPPTSHAASGSASRSVGPEAEAAPCNAADAPDRAPKEPKHQESKQQLQRAGVDSLAGIGRSIQQAAAARGEPLSVSPASASASDLRSTDGASGNETKAQSPAGAPADRTVVVGDKQVPAAAQSSLGSVAEATAERWATVAPAASSAHSQGLASGVSVTGQGRPEGGSQPAVGPPAAARQGFRFASLLKGLDGVQKQEGQKKEAASGAQGKAASPAEDKPRSAIQPASREGTTSTAADSISSAGASAVDSSSSVNGSASGSRSRRFSWRLAAEESERAEAKPEPLAKESGSTPQNPPEGQEASGVEQQPQASPATQAASDPEEGVSSRFARLLNSKLKQKQGVEKQKEATQKDATVAPFQDSEPSLSVPAEKAIGAAHAEQERPPTPDGRDIRSATAAADTPPSASTVTLSAEASASSSSGASGDRKEATDKDMGGTGSRPVADSNSAQCSDSADLHRLLDVWDTAWSKSGDTGTASSTAPAGGSRPPLVSLQANGTVTSAENYRFAASSADGSSAASARSRGGLTGPLGTPAAAGVANGGAAVQGGSHGSGPSSGESLFSRAERLTANGSANLPIESSSGDSSQDGITVRKGAMAAMGVDRQGSIDNRSSYLSQSLLAQESLGGSSSNGAEQSSSALLGQLRAVNDANAAAASVSPKTNGLDGAVANKGGPVTTNGSFPPLPATPAPNGILSNAHDDDEEEVAPPLPATPPPPSYLSGSPAPVVPPLPATPVPKSVLSGLKGGVSNAAEDLLRRATNADALLDMLRGNLPLTPIARGGRGGAAGPLSMVEDDADEEQNGASGNARKRRLARPANGTRTGQGQSNGVQADPVAATRAAIAGAAQAWDTTRAALQQGASGLGLSPNALSESAARLLQQLPKIDLPQQPSAPALPPAVTKIATSLGWGLGNGVVGAQGHQMGEAGAEGLATANGTSVAAEGAAGTAPSGDTPGSLRLVAGAHMIPHVDKVDKGGEDAYFISRVGLGGVGVADGVSGWADEGIDPAEYPRTLMRFATDAYESARGVMSSQDIIRYAQYRTYLKGSSTVCMALMKPGRKLEIANVGDSGVRILRGGKIMFGTEAQQHSFNMPYQLSHPNNVEDPDSADDADVHMVDVQEGDVVMLATDGLFDNVFDAEIEQIVSQQLCELAAAGRGKPPTAATASASEALPAANGGASVGSSSSSGQGGGRSGGAGAGGGRGLLSQSLNAAANGRGAGGQYRPEDAARVARALAERAHMHARNPTQRTPWSVTSSQQPNFMWAKFFAKGGGKMDDCTVLVAFVSGPE